MRAPSSSTRSSSWAWLDDSKSSTNGLVRVFVAMQDADIATAASNSSAHCCKDSDSQRQHPQPHPTDTSVPQLPRAFAAVVLIMELVLVLGVGFLLLLSSTVAGTIAQSVVTSVIGQLQHIGSHAVGSAVGAVARTGVFVFGVLRFTSWFFQRSLTALMTSLGLRTLSFSSIRYVVCYTLAQTLLVSSVMRCEHSRYRSSDLATHSPLFAWTHVPTTDVIALLEPLVLAPVREELFFRGLVALVVWNRIGATSLCSSTVLASALFALAHVANLRHVDHATMSSSYVVYQVAFAWLVGAFLTLRLAVSRSLLECSALHAVTNAFALFVSPKASIAFRDPLVVASMLSQGALFTFGIVHAARRLQEHEQAPSQAKTKAK